jgi:cleavage and polyadenylation specificity factor subunit 3
MGVQKYESITEREERFTKAIDSIVSSGGKCLIPVTTAHAQELLLILDEYWQNHPRLHQKVPTFYVSRQGEKALRVYQTFVNVMNARISALADICNPFQYKHIHNARNYSEVDESGPCVVFAGPGMLQGGVSRQICERLTSLYCSIYLTLKHGI